MPPPGRGRVLRDAVPGQGDRQQVLGKAVRIERFEYLLRLRGRIADAVVGQESVRIGKTEAVGDGHALGVGQGPGERGREDRPVHGPRCRRVVQARGGVLVQACPVLPFTVQEVGRQPYGVLGRPDPVDVGVHSHQGGHVQGEDRTEFRIADPGRRRNGRGVGHPVAAREGVTGGGEHLLALRGAVPDGWECQTPRAGVERLLQAVPDRAPHGRRPCEQQQPGGHLRVQQRVAEKPVQVRERPAVGVVDHQEQSPGPPEAEILPCVVGRDRPGAVDGRDHLPPVVEPAVGTLHGQPRLALPAGAVDPQRRDPGAVGVPPGGDVGEFVRAAGEADDPGPGVEQVAGAFERASLLGRCRAAVFVEQVDGARLLVDVHVAVGDRVGVAAVLGADDLPHRGDTVGGGVPVPAFLIHPAALRCPGLRAVPGPGAAGGR